MTRVDLDTAIDTALNNSVPDNSITPEIEATQIKLVADYVDQEVKTKVVKKTITHAELLTISSSPVIAIPAVVGKMYVPKDILVKYNDNSGWSSVGTWRVLLDTLQLTNFASQMGSGTTTEQFAFLTQGNPSNTTDSFFNKNVYITSSADPAVPVNPLTTVDVYITYFEITL